MSLTVVKVLDEPLVFIAPHRPISEGELRGGGSENGTGAGCHKETDDGRTV